MKLFKIATGLTVCVVMASNVCAMQQNDDEAELASAKALSLEQEQAAPAPAPALAPAPVQQHLEQQQASAQDADPSLQPRVELVIGSPENDASKNKADNKDIKSSTSSSSSSSSCSSSHGSNSSSAHSSSSSSSASADSVEIDEKAVVANFHEKGLVQQAAVASLSDFSEADLAKAFQASLMIDKKGFCSSDKKNEKIDEKIAGKPKANPVGFSGIHPIELVIVSLKALMIEKISSSSSSFNASSSSNLSTSSTRLKISSLLKKIGSRTNNVEVWLEGLGDLMKLPILNIQALQPQVQCDLSTQEIVQLRCELLKLPRQDYSRDKVRALINKQIMPFISKENFTKILKLLEEFNRAKNFDAAGLTHALKMICAVGEHAALAQQQVALVQKADPSLQPCVEPVIAMPVNDASKKQADNKVDNKDVMSSMSSSSSSSSSSNSSTSSSRLSISSSVETKLQGSNAPLKISSYADAKALTDRMMDKLCLQPVQPQAQCDFSAQKVQAVRLGFIKLARKNKWQFLAQILTDATVRPFIDNKTFAEALKLAKGHNDKKLLNLLAFSVRLSGIKKPRQAHKMLDQALNDNDFESALLLVFHPKTIIFFGYCSKFERSFIKLAQVGNLAMVEKFIEDCKFYYLLKADEFKVEPFKTALIKAATNRQSEMVKFLLGHAKVKQLFTEEVKKEALDLLSGKVVKAVKQDEKKEELEDCSICVDTIFPGIEGTSELGCKHRFHTDCINSWLERNLTCPLCRSDVEVAKKRDY